MRFRTICLVVFAHAFLLSRPSFGQREPLNAERDFTTAFDAFSDQLYEQAGWAFSDFITRYPNHVNAPEALYYQAESALALGREELAVQLFSLFYQQYPIHPLASQARLALGKHFYVQGNFDRALEAFESLAEHNPPADVGARALYWMGESALKLERVNDALTYYRRAADEYPETTVAPVALYTLAYTQIDLGRNDDAAASLELLSSRYPESDYSRNLGLALAEVYYDLESYDRAIDEIERRLPFLEGDTRDRAIFLQAESYNQEGRRREAEEAYLRIIDGSAESAYVRPALFGLGWNLYETESYEEAADYFERAAEGSDDVLSEKAVYYAGVSRKLANEPERAVELFQRYVGQWPDGRLAEYALYELAVTFYEQEMWSQAQQAFRDFIERFENSILLDEANYLFGNTYAALGNFNQALAYFDRALSYANIPPELAREVAFQRAWLLYRSGAYSAAGPAFHTFYRQNGDSDRAGQALFWAADSYYQAEAYDRAVDLYNDYLRAYRNGENAEAARYALAWVFFKNKEYNRAADAFEAFLDSYQGSGRSDMYRTDARLRLADSYYALKRFPEAIRTYNEVASEGGDYALFQIGQAYSNAGRLDEALRTFTRLISNYPQSEWRWEAQYQLGYLNFMNQQYDLAIQEYEKILQAVPRELLAAKAQYGIGDAHFNAGRMREAADAYRRVIEFYPDSPYAADAASSIQYALIAGGEDNRSSEVIDEFTRRNPDSPVADELRFRQAEVKYQTGAVDEALEELTDFVATTRNTSLLPAAYYYLGVIHADRQEYNEAVSHLRRIVDPADRMPLAGSVRFSSTRNGMAKHSLFSATWKSCARTTPAR